MSFTGVMLCVLWLHAILITVLGMKYIITTDERLTRLEGWLTSHKFVTDTKIIETDGEFLLNVVETRFFLTHQAKADYHEERVNALSITRREAEEKNDE